MRRLHKLCQEGSGDAGPVQEGEQRNHRTPAPVPRPVVRFKCVSAKGTPAAVDELCLVYRHH